MSMFKFELQHFAEEAENNGENITPATVEQENAPEKKSFDELIRGEFRDEYGKRVEEVVKKRLKDHAELKRNMGQLSDALEQIKAELGIEAQEPELIVSAIRERLASAPQNANAEGADSHTEGAKDEGESSARLALIKLIKGADKAREYYPQFDLKRELSDPAFRKMLVLTGNDPKRAFEMLHHDEIMASAVRDAARLAEEKLAGSIATKAKRPLEGASSASAPIAIDQNPSSLTKEQRADIKKRVRRGEKIRWI